VFPVSATQSTEITVILLIGNKCPHAVRHPDGFLGWDPTSVEIVPESRNRIAKGRSRHIRRYNVDADIELGEIIPQTPHYADDLID
jgi:hypothetical protein